MKSVIISDKCYPDEKAREGIGVNFAFANGLCDVCPYLEDCESNRGFGFPKDAACSKHADSLKERQDDERQIH